MAATRARVGADLFDVVFRPGVRVAAPEGEDAPRDGSPPVSVLEENRLRDVFEFLPDDADRAADPTGGRQAPRPGASPPRARPAVGQGSLFGGSGPGGAPRAAGACPGAREAPAKGAATDRQIGFAHDISKALRIPLPEGRDVEAVSAFIALHRHRLKGNRGRP